MNDSPWKSQSVGQHCISGIDILIYHHSVYSDNILMCLSKECDFWYQASHCLQHFVETPVTLQAYFFQKMPELSWQPLLGTLTYQLLTSVQWGKGYVHLALKHLPPTQRPSPFLGLVPTLYVETNWSNRSTPPICLLKPSKSFNIGTSTHFLADSDHRRAVLTGLQVT